MQFNRSNHLRTAGGLLVAGFLLLTATLVRPAAAQSAEGPDEMAKMTNYSLYYEDFKAGNYVSALKYVRWMLENAPGYAGPGRQDDRNFERAVVIYDSMAAQTAEPELARAYLDSAFALHDQAVSTLTDMGVEVDEAKWILDKGRFIQKHLDVMPEREAEMIGYYQQAYDMNPEEMDPYYITTMIRSYAQTDKQRAVEFMEEVETRFADDANVTGYIAQVRDALFSSPEERMTFLEGQFEKSPEDVEIATELFEIYQELGERDKAYAMGDKLMTMEPTADIYRILAKLRLDDGQPEKAFDLYEQAVELAGEATVRDYYNMGISQQQMGRLSNARTYFREALQVDPNFGAALIAIGDLYATAVSNCGSFEREDRAVYWLVVDYYNRAKSADSSIANAANNKIRTYQQSYPDQEALFFKGWEPGQSYRVDYGCYAWINEATTVKAP